MARARSDDPLTSHEAASGVEEHGQAEVQRDICLRRVQLQPGLTAAEIADSAGLERHMPSRRLPELRNANLVVNGPARKCLITGNKSMTWNLPPLPEGLFGDISPIKERIQQ